MNWRDVEDLAWRERSREPSALRGIVLIGILIVMGYLALTALAGCSAIFATGCAPHGCKAPVVEVPQVHLPGHLRDRDAQIAAAVSIDVKCGLGAWVGSGTLISPTQVLTARHVAHCDWDDAPTITVRRLTGTADAFPAHLAWESEEWDEARIELAGGAHFDGVTVPDLAPPPEPGAGDVCFVSVQPMAMVQCGARRKDDDHVSTGADVVHDATTVPGNSGSGVYDRAGRLVGVVTQYVNCTPTGELKTYCGGRASSVWGRAGVLPP
jgi:hypothetical protein